MKRTTKGSKKDEAKKDDDAEMAAKPDDEDEEKEGDDEETKKEKAARKAKKKEEAEKAKKDEEDEAIKAKKADEESEKAQKAEDDKAEKAAKADEKKEPYGDVEYADEGHQKDKKKRYPLDTEEHIRAAWNYINKEKNADKYDPADLKSIKAKIVAAWKEKIDKDGPPSASEKAAGGDLKKGMHGVSHLAHLLQSIDCLLQESTFEEAMEGDESDMPEKLKA